MQNSVDKSSSHLVEADVAGCARGHAVHLIAALGVRQLLHVLLQAVHGPVPDLVVAVHVLCQMH